MNTLTLGRTMPDGTTDVRIDRPVTTPGQPDFRLCELKEKNPDAIGAIVRSVAFRGKDYAIYRSERGVYVQFSDDPATRQSQMAAYVKLSVQICELRYLTSQMRPGIIGQVWRHSKQDTIYLESADFSVIFWQPVPFAHGRESTARIAGRVR